MATVPFLIATVLILAVLTSPVASIAAISSENNFVFSSNDSSNGQTLENLQLPSSIQNTTSTDREPTATMLSKEGINLQLADNNTVDQYELANHFAEKCMTIDEKQASLGANVTGMRDLVYVVPDNVAGKTFSSLISGQFPKHDADGGANQTSEDIKITQDPNFRMPAIKIPEHDRHFQHGTIYWSSDTCAHWISNTNGMDSRYHWLKGPWGPLGFPITDEIDMHDAFQGHQAGFKHGVIMSSPTQGAHMINNKKILKEFYRNIEVLGYPNSDTKTTPDGLAQFNNFEHGGIYSHPDPSIGTHEVHGAIYAKWEETGWEWGPLGYPTSNQLRTPDGLAQFNNFEHGGIYSHPALGTFDVSGQIYNKWAQLGYERSFLGYPITGKISADDLPGADVSNFQHGRIYWSSGNLPIADYYSKTFETGYLTTDEPLGGTARVTMKSNGDFIFSGNWHESGAFCPGFELTLTVSTPNGLSYTAHHKGAPGGTFCAAKRDDNWNVQVNYASIRDNWDQITHATMTHEHHIVLGDPPAPLFPQPGTPTGNTQSCPSGQRIWSVDNQCHILTTYYFAAINTHKESFAPQCITFSQEAPSLMEAENIVNNVLKTDHYGDEYEIQQIEGNNIATWCTDNGH